MSKYLSEMKNHVFYCLFIISVLILPKQVFTQAEDTTQIVTGYTFEDVWAKGLEMAAPDTTFVPMKYGNGWEEPATQSLIVCIPTADNFQKLANEDLSGNQLPGGSIRILSKENKAINGVPYMEVFAEITENEAPPFYIMMFYRSLGENATLMVNAIYPKTQHERLYPKMLASFATVRVKE
ncbi:MAG: hypothetical protein KA165_15975 [Saprospiraceae bacterium]|nr:hypothetical protein [Saprospiraceae bacterium]